MIQVIKREKINGIIHESLMSFSAPEWALIQQHYGQGNITFSLAKKEKPKKAVENKTEEKDDKPEMVDYELNKLKAKEHWNNKEYDKALRYFELAQKDKDGVWLKGRINKCKKFLEDEANNSDR